MALSVFLFNDKELVGGDGRAAQVLSIIGNVYISSLVSPFWICAKWLLRDDQGHDDGDGGEKHSTQLYHMRLWLSLGSAPGLLSIVTLGKVLPSSTKAFSEPQYSISCIYLRRRLFYNRGCLGDLVNEEETTPEEGVGRTRRSQ